MQESIWLSYLIFDAAVVSIIILSYLGIKSVAYLLSKYNGNHLNNNHIK
jgi:hypothetical protein